MNAGTVRPSRIINASARCHVINADRIGTGVIETRATTLPAIKLHRNSGNSSKPSSRGPHRSRIPRISRATGRCTAQALRGRPKARRRPSTSSRIAIGDVGRSKPTPNKKRA